MWTDLLYLVSGPISKELKEEGDEKQINWDEILKCVFPLPYSKFAQLFRCCLGETDNSGLNRKTILTLKIRQKSVKITTIFKMFFLW